MSQPVKLSDALVLDARVAGLAMERSIAGQVELWAKLGRAIEPLMEGVHVISLCRRSEAHSLTECLDSVDSPSGRQRVAEYLETLPFPRYEAHPHEAGLLVRIEENGTRTIGRFVNRKFQKVRAKAV